MSKKSIEESIKDNTIEKDIPSLEKYNYEDNSYEIRDPQDIAFASEDHRQAYINCFRNQ